MIHSELLSAVTYSKETGRFHLLQGTLRRNKGDRIDVEHPNGYLMVHILNENNAAHRLAWFYVTGTWPIYEIDHKDRRKSNNKWDNLQDITHAANSSNREFPTTTGARGISFHVLRSKWRAEYKNRYIGSYATKELAIAHREAHINSLTAT